MIGQVVGAQLLRHAEPVMVDLAPLGAGISPKAYTTRFVYDAYVGPGNVYVGQPKTDWDMYRNTLMYSILKRKQHSGEWSGNIIVEK